MIYKFLIYISHSYAIPIGNPLEKEIIKRGFDVFWFSEEEEGKKALNSKNNSLETIQDVIKYSPHILLAATDNAPDFVKALKIQIFHGFLSHKRPENNFSEAHFRIRGFFDLYCTQGPSTTAEFTKLSKKLKHFEVVETGWSKMDPLFPLKKVKRKSGKPTVMIASTFTKRLSLAYNDGVFNKIKTMSKSGKFRFIAVLHPKIPKTVVDKWKQLESEDFNYVSGTNLIPLFKESDIMFSDTTSAIQEFLLQKKPVVTFKHTKNHPYLINVNEVEEIEKAIENALKNPEDLIQKIVLFNKDLHPYCDGKSSVRVIDESINFLHKDKTYLKIKPLNLIRKFKIRKKLKKFSFKSYGKAFTLKR